jgi:hypothetical protein
MPNSGAKRLKAFRTELHVLLQSLQTVFQWQITRSSRAVHGHSGKLYIPPIEREREGGEERRRIQTVTIKRQILPQYDQQFKRLVLDILPIVVSYQQSTVEEVTSHYVNVDPVSKYVTHKHKAKTSQHSRK